MNLKAAILEECAGVAQALAAPARLAILEQLAQCERGVEALSGRAGLSVANCSQHLQQLRRAGLVTCRREGKSVIYRLAEGQGVQLLALLHRVAERNLAQAEDLLGGIAGAEPLTRDELALRMAEGLVVVLDLRPFDEYAAGHLPGAVNVALPDVAALAEGLVGSAEVVAYCRGPLCLWAHQAVAALRARGVKARRMEGGLPDWRAEGRPVVVGRAA